MAFRKVRAIPASTDTGTFGKVSPLRTPKVVTQRFIPVNHLITNASTSIIDEEDDDEAVLNFQIFGQKKPSHFMKKTSHLRDRSSERVKFVK